MLYAQPTGLERSIFMRKNTLSILFVILIMFISCVQSPTTPENSENTEPTQENQKKYEVTFISDGEIFLKVNVTSGNTVSISENPTKSGYCLLGWFTDTSFTKYFDFKTPINSDISLYAKWIDKSLGYVCKLSEFKDVLISLPQYGGLQKIIIAEVIPDLSIIEDILQEVAPTSKIHLDLSLCTGLETIPTFCLWSSHLTKITIPHTIRKIQSSFPFNDLKEIYFDGTLEEWFNVEFNDKNSYFDDVPVFINGKTLTEIIIPETVTKINQGLFAGMDITSVTFHNNLKSIGDGAFMSTKLSNIIIPDSVEYIGSLAFSNSALTSITISNSSNLITIGTSAFSNTKIASFYIPSKISYLSENLFYNSKLESMTIPATIKSIGDYCFNGCENLTNVKILKGVEYIGAYAFGAYAFRSGVNTITFDGTQSEWNQIEKDPNYGSSYLKTIKCNDGNISL